MWMECYTDEKYCVSLLMYIEIIIKISFTNLIFSNLIALYRLIQSYNPCSKISFISDELTVIVLKETALHYCFVINDGSNPVLRSSQS